jgi:hypothetical protein
VGPGRPRRALRRGERIGRYNRRAVCRRCSFADRALSKPEPVSGICQRLRPTWQREVKVGFCLRRLENGEHAGGTTEVKQATALGGDVLVVAGAVIFP